MDGPVTFARAMRGEIPMRGSVPQEMMEGGKAPWVDAKAGGKDIMDEDGLKLRLELNLDIEIELKASIHGDLTLALWYVLLPPFSYIFSPPLSGSFSEPPFSGQGCGRSLFLVISDNDDWGLTATSA